MKGGKEMEEQDGLPQKEYERLMKLLEGFEEIQ